MWLLAVRLLNLRPKLARKARPSLHQGGQGGKGRADSCELGRDREVVVLFDLGAGGAQGDWQVASCSQLQHNG